MRPRVRRKSQAFALLARAGTPALLSMPPSLLFAPPYDAALFSRVIYPLCEALLEARKEVLNFLQEKEQQAVYVRGPTEERGPSSRSFVRGSATCGR